MVMDCCECGDEPSSSSYQYTQLPEGSTISELKYKYSRLINSTDSWIGRRKEVISAVTFIRSVNKTGGGYSLGGIAYTSQLKKI
jgi:hypothetical protein